MDIYNLNTPIKQFSISELQQIWLSICFDINRYSGNDDFDFYRDFMFRLEFRNELPFDRIRWTGITSAKFTDLLVTTNIGFYSRLTDTISDTIFYLNDRMQEVSINELETIYGVGPIHARKFHHSVRQPDDPIVANTAILDKPTRNWIREQGFYLPSNMNRFKYREYEKTYLILTGRL